MKLWELVQEILILAAIGIALGVFLAFISGCYWPYCQEREKLTLRPAADCDGVVVEYSSEVTYGSFNLLTNRKSDSIFAQSDRVTIISGYNETLHDPNLWKALGAAGGNIVGGVLTK
jgi:hypothetical protein